jgi:hypothetical protein
MIDAYPLTWPPQWPRTQHPEFSRFETTIARARDGVIRELELLGATDIIISSNAELTRTGDIASRQRYLADTGVALYCSLNGEQRCIPCDKWMYLQDNLHAIEKTIGALRGIERWGTHQILEADLTGFAALPDGSDARPWHVVLGVMPLASAAEIKAAYLRLVKLPNPNVIGDPERFHRIQQAYEQAIAS